MPKWPRRAKAMMSKDGYLTSSGKPKCTTTHSTQLKVRIEEALSRNVQTVPVRPEEKVGRCLLSGACVHARSIEASSIPHRQRAVPSETAASKRILCVHGSRCRGTCVHTVESDVPLDSVFVWFAVRCLSFVSVVPHWHRGHVTVESSVRHCAAVDLERSGCKEKTWTTVRRTMITFERGHDHPRAATWSCEV